MTSSQAFELVAKELREGTLKEGLWLECLAASEGNQEKTKGLYAQRRASELISESSALVRKERERLMEIRNRIASNSRSPNGLKALLAAIGNSPEVEQAKQLSAELEALIDGLELTSDGVPKKAALAAERVAALWRRNES